MAHKRWTHQEDTLLTFAMMAILPYCTILQHLPGRTLGAVLQRIYLLDLRSPIDVGID